MKATICVLLASLTWVSTATPLAQDPVVRITPDELKWESKPEDLGFSQAIVEGDPAKTVPLRPGSYMKHPAGTYHYDGAKDEEVIVQLMGMGPSTTTKKKPDEGLFGRSLPEQKIKK